MRWFSKKPLALYIKERVALIEKGEVLTKQGKKYSYASKQRIVGILRQLEAYEKITKVAYAQEMDDKWFEGFLSYLISLGLKKNTINSSVRNLVSILRKFCKENKVFCLVDEFRYGPEITTQVFNNVAEIKKIIGLDLSSLPGLEAIRDAYVIQCYTGLRRSDLKTLLSDISLYTLQENGRKYFRIRTAKTDTVVVIPIANAILQILERRNWKLKHCSIQLYNRQIKHIAELAGITQSTEVYFTKNGQKTKEVYPKNELMSSHTARRSFATNAFLAGIPTLKIRQITGHTTEASFMAYIRSDGMESASTIVDAPFFRD